MISGGKGWQHSAPPDLCLESSQSQMGPRKFLKLFIGRSSRGTGGAEPVRRLILQGTEDCLNMYLQVPGKAARAMVKFGENYRWNKVSTQAWGSVPREEGAARGVALSPGGGHSRGAT